MRSVHEGNASTERVFATDQYPGAKIPHSGAPALPQVPWMPVAQGLPDADLLVLIALNDDDVWTGYLDADGWRYVDAMPITSERVTHWMHLPAHPGVA